ncbi:MAG: tRNA (uridine(34)/cytosine(34)/5-carboxymethylaminomethyluridine(34)-2'-O)-methyltransferase TrmL [Christensenellales bacterium]
MAFNIVLVSPEIPQNTGNIARTCAATGTKLHLIKPLGFSLADRYLKRAGLDYWDKLELKIYEDIDQFEKQNAGERLFLLSTKGDKAYTEVEFKDGDFLVFGRETAGLPDEFLERRGESVLRIPMRGGLRSLNLSNSCAIVLYEALRQTGFASLI